MAFLQDDEDARPEDETPQIHIPNYDDSHEDSFSFCSSNKENHIPDLPYQVTVSLGGHQMSFEGFIKHDDTGHSPVALAFTLPTQTAPLDVKLSMSAQRNSRFSSPRNIRRHVTAGRSGRSDNIASNRDMMACDTNYTDSGLPPVFVEARTSTTIRTLLLVGSVCCRTCCSTFVTWLGTRS